MQKKKKDPDETNKSIRLSAGIAHGLVTSPIMDQVLKKQFPIKTSYWLARILRKIQSELTDFNRLRQTLLEKYGEKDPKTGRLAVINGAVDLGKNMAAFQKDYAELAEIELDIGFYPLPIDLERWPDLSIDEMLWLAPLLAEDDNEGRQTKDEGR